MISAQSKVQITTQQNRIPKNANFKQLKQGYEENTAPLLLGLCCLKH
jgi:hypothetical protein